MPAKCRHFHKYGMRSTEFLTETILNLWTPEDKRKHADEVWDMLQKAYASIGGFKSAANPDELIATPGYWKVVKRGNEITAVNIYRKVETTDNFKTIASAARTIKDPETDVQQTSPAGRADYRKMKGEDIKMKRSWAEVSGAAEKVMQKAGAMPVPSKYAHFLTGKEILDHDEDGIHYTRLIQGKPYVKSIYGIIRLSKEAKEELKRLGVSVKDLPGNVD